MNEVISAIENTFCKTFLEPGRFIIALLISILTFLIGDLSKNFITAIFVFFIADWTTGILASMLEKIHKTGPYPRSLLGFILKMMVALSALSSTRMSKGLVKLIIYLTLMTIAYYLPQVNSAVFALADNIIYSSVAVTEIISILENLVRIDDVVNIKIPFLKPLMKKFRAIEKCAIDALKDDKKGGD